MVILLTASLTAFLLGSCPDTILAPGTSVYRGAAVVAFANVSDAGGCCSLCHTLYHDECHGWQFLNFSAPAPSPHNCDIFASLGPPAQDYPGRVTGVVRSPPTPPPGPPPPAPPQVGTPCHSDGDCEAQWGTPEWRCLERAALPSAANGCHMHAEAANSTCACQVYDSCRARRRLGSVPTAAATAAAETSVTKRMLVIGDSISEGMFPDLHSNMARHNWSLAHNPGNGDNTNFGAHCVGSWVGGSSSGGSGGGGGGAQPWDVISFQFGLHDIAYDEERMSVAQYARQLANITAVLTAVQAQHGTRLLWVKTTPVPTVPMWGPNCTDASACMNPARLDADVRLYNAAADAVMSAAVGAGASICTADLYDYVIQQCGGSEGYTSCDGFQLPVNVHFTATGFAALAAEMERILLSEFGS